jgi:hypothetical protein
MRRTLPLWRPPHGRVPNIVRAFNSNSGESRSAQSSEYTFNPVKAPLIQEVRAYLFHILLIYKYIIICYG